MALDKRSSGTNNRKVWDCIVSEIKKDHKGLATSGSPQVVSSPFGKAVWFNGERDGYFMEENPLYGLSDFTIEAIFRPDIDGPEEQRFLHIGGTDSDRLLLETRLTPENMWFLDTFILCGESKKAVIDPNLQHPAGRWYHVALTLDKKGKMTNYVNGRMELSGDVEFKPINSGALSIGARRNRVSWFLGAIYRIRVSPQVLEPKDFLKF
jgi:hypothetical protein